MKPLNSTLALGFYPWVSTEGRAKWLFLFLHSIPQGGIANGLHGLNPRNTAHGYTPVQNVTSVGMATGKAVGNSGGQLGQRYKRTHPSCALGLCDCNELKMNKLNELNDTNKDGEGRILLVSTLAKPMGETNV